MVAEESSMTLFDYRYIIYDPLTTNMDIKKSSDRHGSIMYAGNIYDQCMVTVMYDQGDV